MFTGIIAATGIIERLQHIGGDVRLHVHSEKMDFSSVQLGDSIAVSGVCLTAIETDKQGFAADVSRETLAVTTAKDWHQGMAVNLELALQPQSRLGGHIVSGHVDGIGEMLRRYPDGRSERLEFKVPAALARYIAHKGSVCIDGVSLTVNAVNEAEFGVNIIPHTAERTTLHAFKAGQQVNIEVDVIARYLERLLQGVKEDSKAGITFDQLARSGFIKQ